MSRHVVATRGRFATVVALVGLATVTGCVSIESNLSIDTVSTTEATGALADVTTMTVYVADIELWGAVNEVYARVLGENRPARAVVPTGALHYGFLVEIEAVAAVG